jgi:hypothetical protein
MAFELRPYILLENLSEIRLFVKEKVGASALGGQPTPLDVLFSVIF